jgi:putative transcriptional regulator
MATAHLRPGIVDRVQKLSGIQSDDAFARTVGVSLSTLNRARATGDGSIRLIAGIAHAFGYGLGEIAVAAPDDGNAAVTELAS